jgi:D-serine deaminase-like pyridoxal phosphate-dependent protein
LKTAAQLSIVYKTLNNCCLERKKYKMPADKKSQIGCQIENLPTPCLVVSKSAVMKNCQKMLEKAEKMGVQLRGQTKTHKTVEGAVLQTGGTTK